MGACRDQQAAVANGEPGHRQPFREPADPTTNIDGGRLQAAVRVEGVKIPAGGAFVDRAVGHHRRCIEEAVTGKRPLDELVAVLGIDGVVEQVIALAAVESRGRIGTE